MFSKNIYSENYHAVYEAVMLDLIFRKPTSISSQKSTLHSILSFLTALQLHDPH